MEQLGPGQAGRRPSQAVRAARPWQLAVAASAVAAMLAATLVSTTAPADAAAADPVREEGVISRVVDGDTVMFVEDGSSEETRIRLSGIQAFEIGECGYDIATDRLTELVEGERVELRAREADGTSDGRPIRSIHLPLASGGTADIIELLLLEGLGLWFPIEPEITDTANYHVAATHARNEGRGIWQDDLCGEGPQYGHPIDMWVKSSADGDDTQNVNGEYVRIVNRHETEALDLSGWLLRESSQFRVDPIEEGYRFPSATTVPPGESMVVRVGEGTNTALEHFMGSPYPIFDNADRTTGTDQRPDADLGMGDGAYLLDPLGNVREAYTYPCVVDCTTDLYGKLQIDEVVEAPWEVDHTDTEYVAVRNVSDDRISLDGYQLRNIWYAHEFELGTELDPDEVLTVWVDDGDNQRLEQYTGSHWPGLNSEHDRVDLVSFDERYVDCVDWGTGRECPWPVEIPGEGSSPALPTEPELVGDEPPEPGPFPDVPADGTHTDAIEWLVDREITAGCAAGGFCPGDAVTRAQMATFLMRALDLDAGSVTAFGDVDPDGTHADGIGALVDQEITAGCGDGVFCPAQDVTRAQMATFLMRALDLDPADGSRFDDVAASHTHVEAIGALADAGVTSGCGGDAFCPNDPVSRAQMATFLRNALE